MSTSMEMFLIIGTFLLLVCLPLWGFYWAVNAIQDAFEAKAPATERLVNETGAGSILMVILLTHVPFFVSPFLVLMVFPSVMEQGGFIFALVLFATMVASLYIGAILLDVVDDIRGYDPDVWWAAQRAEAEAKRAKWEQHKKFMGYVGLHNEYQVDVAINANDPGSLKLSDNFIGAL